MSVAISNSSALVDAITIVNRTTRRKIQTPESIDDLGEINLQIGRIARASGLRVRNVLLSDNWWNEDSGPMLGFLDEQRYPVALVRSRRGYQIIDPSSGRKIPVDEESVQHLSVDARVFADSLPTDIAQLSQIPLWAAKEVWPDIGFVVTLALLTTLIGMLVP